MLGLFRGVILEKDAYEAFVFLVVFPPPEPRTMLTVPLGVLALMTE